jgi:hypothetical protein
MVMSQISQGYHTHQDRPVHYTRRGDTDGLTDMARLMAGAIGIFWVPHDQLITAAVPLAEGIDDGLFINGLDDHDPYLGECAPHACPSATVGLFSRATGVGTVQQDCVLCLCLSRSEIVSHHDHTPDRRTRSPPSTADDLPHRPARSHRSGCARLLMPSVTAGPPEPRPVRRRAGTTDACISQATGSCVADSRSGVRSASQSWLISSGGDVGERVVRQASQS